MTYSHKIWQFKTNVEGDFLTAPPPQKKIKKITTKKKTANQPITAFLINKIYWNSSCDWLIGGFLFGTKNLGGKLKNHRVNASVYALSITHCTKVNIYRFKWSKSETGKR